MKNIYFPDEDITYNDLYFVCYMIERVARYLHQPDRYVVGGIGRSELERLLSIANVQHCENPLKIRDEWIEEYALERGDFDVSDVDESMETRVPTDLQMGKVYARPTARITRMGSCASTTRRSAEGSMTMTPDITMNHRISSPGSIFMMSCRDTYLHRKIERTTHATP